MKYIIKKSHESNEKRLCSIGDTASTDDCIGIFSLLTEPVRHCLGGQDFLCE